MPDCDKGQTKHLSSMSSLWRTTRMSRWMTPTLTTALIRSFLNLFPVNALLLIFSGLRQSHSLLHLQRVWLWLAGLRLWSLESSLTLIARLGAFQRLEHCPPSGKTGSLRRFPTACPPHTERRVSNWLIFLIFWHHDIVSRLDNPNLLCRCFH